MEADRKSERDFNKCLKNSGDDPGAIEAAITG